MKSSLRLFIGFLTAFLVVSSVFGSAMAMSGTGSASEPFIVTSDSDLKALGTNIGTYANKYIELGADIVCSGNQTPIGNNTTPFIGHFDGKNHTITNMNISGTEKQGLFGQCGSSFSIKNLKLVNCHVTASSSYCGMLIGYVYQASGAVVENIETVACKVDSSSSYVGGIVGMGVANSSGSVTYRNCYVHDGYVVTSSFNSYVGGIVGSGSSGGSSNEFRCENCRVVNEYLCSTNNDFTVVGGIVGMGAASSNNVTYSGCEVRDCVVNTTGTVVGGIAGDPGSFSKVNYTNCVVYNTMVQSKKSNSNAYVGGICGYAYSLTTVTITNPVVDGCTITAPNGYLVAGISGYSNATVNISNPTVRNCSIIGLTKVSGVANNS